MKTRFEFSRLVMLLPLVVVFSSQAFAQNVVLYERPNFEGRSREFGVGKYRMQQDFNDLAASIRVPAGLVVVVYEHADEGGGYGAWVDFLEDQPDLSRYNFQGKISYLDVFPSRQVVEAHDHRAGSSGSVSMTTVYARNSMQNGQFVPGHWEGLRAGGNPVNAIAVVGPPKPPNKESTGGHKALIVCTISGQITGDKPEYHTQIHLNTDDNAGTTVMSVPVSAFGKYIFQNVPAGNYRVVPKGDYPNHGGREGGLDAFPDPPGSSTNHVSCKPGRTYTANFKIDSTEG